MKKNLIKITVPLLILVLSVASWGVMAKLSPKPEVVTKKASPPVIQTVTARRQTVTLFVEAHGVVEPRTETILVAQVSGKIIRVSPSFHSGGFFNKGDMVLEIESGDYEAAIAGAEVELARAELKLAREEVLAGQAEKDWQELGEGKAPSLVVRNPQLMEARAGVKFAVAELERAKRQCGRTRIVAPYPAMVRKKSVGIGQYVGPGTELGSVFAMDFAEVRLPVKSDDLAYLNLPKVNRDKQEVSQTRVQLSSTIGGEVRHWEGQIVRTEGTIDSLSHVLYVVVRIPDPYGLKDHDSRQPLMIGTFVKARLKGKSVRDVVVLPPNAVRNSDTALIVDSGDCLYSRKIKIFHADSERVVIMDGISPGETVCLTPLDYMAEGMTVRPVSQEKSKNPQGLKTNGGVS